MKPKDLLNPYLAAGAAAEMAKNVDVESKTASTIDRMVGRIALKPIIGCSIDNIEEYAEVESWHGTGRYKYKDGEVVDVLSSIAESGHLIPKLDKFDLDRPMVTISLAKSRMYARAYADMHGQGNAQTERYGSSLFWACSFLGSVAVEASKELKVWRPEGYKKMMAHLAVADTVEWYKNITRVHNPGAISAYRDGSDIEGNYPVLFGVRQVEEVETSKAVSVHEIRTDKPIDIERGVTHVEVPRSKMEETRSILGGLAIRAIEDGESYSSNYTFTQHIHGIV